MKNFLSKTVLGIMFALAAPASVAQWSGNYYYIGTGAGQAILQDFCPSSPAPGTSCSDVERSLRVFGGHQDDNSGRGWEIAYMRTNDFSLRDQDNPLIIHRNDKIQSLQMTSVFKFPVNYNLSFFMRIGFHIWQSESTARISGGDRTVTAEGDGQDYMYGLGLDYRLGDAVSMAVEWQRLPLNSMDMDDLSISYRYRL